MTGEAPRLSTGQEAVEFDPAVLEAATRREEAARQTAMLSQFRAALQQDARLAGRAYSLAGELGEDPETVASNVKIAEQLRQEQALKHARQSQRYPATVKMMEDVWFAKAAHPDLDKLTETEGIFETIGRGLAWPFKQIWSGPQQIEQGFQGAWLAKLEASNQPTEETMARLNELDTALAGQGQGWIAGPLNVLGQIGAIALPSAAAGLGAATVATPAAAPYAAGATAFGINSISAAGQSYWQMRKQGIPPDVAYARAAMSGVAQGALETLSQVVGAKFAGKLGKASGLLADASVKAARASMVKEAGKVFLAELGTELSQTAVDFVAQQSALRASGFETPDQLKNFTEQMWDTAVQTMQATALLAGLGGYVGHMTDLRYARQVEERANALDKLKAAVDAPGVATTAPELYDKFLNQAQEEHDIGTMYVRGEDMHKVYNQLDPEEKLELEKKLPGVTEQMESAIRDSGDVELPTSKVVRAVPKLFDALKPHIRFDPSEPSLAQVQEAMTAATEEAKKLSSAVDRTVEEEKQWQKEIKTIEDDLTDQIKKAGRKAGEARANAELWGKIIGVAATYARTTPAKLAKQFPLSVVTGAAPAGVLKQPRVFSSNPEAYYRAFDEADDAVSRFRHVLKGNMTGYGGGFTLEFSADPERVYEVGTNQSLRTRINPDAVTRIFYQPDYWEGGNPEELAKVRAAFPRAEIVAVKLNDDHSGFIEVPMPGLLRQPARGSFDPSTWIVRLNKAADASTAAHELFHGALQMHRALAQDGETGAPFRAKLEPFAKWSGFDSVEALLAADPDAWEKAQEKGASAWETYLATGKAPTEELRGLFTKFMLWMRDLLLRGVIKREELQPEVRSFFDSLLATEDELALAQAQRGLSDVYFADGRSGFDGTDEQWAEIESLRETLAANSLGALAQDSLKATTFVKRLLGKIDSKFAKEEKARRKEAGEQAADEVTSKPVDLLRTWLKTSTKKEPHRLNTDQIREAAGVSAHDVLTALEGYHTNEGETTDAEALAVIYGYTSAEQMLLDLATAPDRATMIEERTEQILRENDPEFFDKSAREELIVTAIHDEVRTKLAATIIKVLQKEKKPNAVSAQAIKIAATTRLENTAVSSLDPRIWSRLAGRAHQQALKLLKEGKVDDAILSLRHEMLHNEMARKSVALRKEADRTVKSWGRFAGSNETIAKTRSLNYVNAGRALLAKFGVGGGARANEALDRLAEYAPDIHQRLAAIIQLASSAAIYEGRSYQDLSLTEFRQLDAALDSLWESAKNDKMMMLEGKEAVRAEVAATLVKAATEVWGLPDRVARAEAELKAGTITVEQYEQRLAAPLTKDERKAVGISNLLNQLKIVEHLAVKLDGGKLDGWWTRAIVRPVMNGYNAYLERRAVMTKEALADLRKIEKSLRTTKIDATREGEIGHVFADGAELLDFLGHIGSPDNKRIALLGFGWATETMDPTTKEMVLDTSRWDRTFKRLVKEKVITEEMLDYAQRAWDRNESLKAEAQQANKELHDVYFKEVEAQSFTVRFPDGAEKTYRGGYAHAPRDLDHPKNALIGSRPVDDVLAIAESEIADIVSANPSFTRERTGGTGPLILDPRLHVRHLDQVLRFIHMQRPFRDVVMLLRDPVLAGYLKGVDPEMVDKLLLPWLKDTFNNRLSQPGKAAQTVGRMLNFIRRNAGLQALGGKIVNAAQQFTGISNIGVYVPDQMLIARLTAKSLKQTGSSAPDSLWSTAVKKSQAMRLRLVHHIGQIDNDLKLLLDPSTFEKIQNWASESIFGYMLQRSVQARTDLVAWHAGYEHAKAKNATEEEAIQQADAVVRLSQGEHTPASMPAFQRGTPLMKLIFQFGAYNNLILNQITAAWPNLGTGQRAMLVARALMIPTLMSSAIMFAAAGGEPYKDEDKDGEVMDNAAYWWIKQQARAGLALIPVAGPVVSQLLTAPGVASDRMSFFPAVTQLKGMARMWGELEREVDYLTGNRFDQPRFTGQRWRDAATFIGMLTGLPMSWIGNAIGFYVDVNDPTKRNRPTPDNLLQWVGGLTGNYK